MSEPAPPDSGDASMSTDAQVLPSTPGRTTPSGRTGSSAAPVMSIPRLRDPGVPHLMARPGQSPRQHATSPHRVIPAMSSPIRGRHAMPVLSSPSAMSPQLAARERAWSLGQYPNSAPGSWNGQRGRMPPTSPGAGPARSLSLSPVGANPAFLMPNHKSHMMMPDLPTLSPPPTLSASQKAMETAVRKERTRAKAMEQEELNLSADELRVVLKKERTRMSRLAADLAALKSAAVESQAEAEVIEEGRINNLMRRLECLQQEKGRIIVELEREEEMLTNTLQKKLDEVRQEKIQLEKQIEREHRDNTNLKSKLTKIQTSPGLTTGGFETVEESQEEEDGKGTEEE